MAETVLYIAASIDGYIARSDGNLDWLTSMPAPENEDYGYAALLQQTGIIIMGRKTYEEILNMGVEWPYAGFQTYIATTNKKTEILSEDTYLLHENLMDFVAAAKNNSAKNIWLVGGGQLIASFLRHGLLDKMIITIIPKTLGSGIPLFQEHSTESAWNLIETKSFDTGVVQIIYGKVS